MSNDKKPKPDPFFSGNGDEFIKEEPAKGWEPPPPDPLLRPPPARIAVSFEAAQFIRNLMSVLRAMAKYREHFKTYDNIPAQLLHGYDPFAIAAAFNEARVDLALIKEDLYLNPHVSNISRAVPVVEPAVREAFVRDYADDLAKAYVDPKLEVHLRQQAYEFFLAVISLVVNGKITEAMVLDRRQRVKTPIPRPNPWGEDA